MKRIQWIDYAKFISIISIVLGHTNFPYSKYLYWFHVPIFFVISGFLFNEKAPFKVFLVKRIKMLWIPYFIFGIFSILIYNLLINYSEPYVIIKEISKLLYGGRKLIGVIGAYWFLPVLFLTETTAFLLIKLCNRYSRLIIILVGYIIYHFYLKEMTLPLNVNTVFVSLIYFLFGFYLKSAGIRSNKLINIFSTCILAVFLFCYKLNFIDLTIDLKKSVSAPIVLDILIPVSIVVVIIYICKLVQNISFLNLNFMLFIGRNSLYIMLVHNTFIIALEENHITNWVIVFTITLLISISLSYIVSAFIARRKLLSTISSRL